MGQSLSCLAKNRPVEETIQAAPKKTLEMAANNSHTEPIEAPVVSITFPAMPEDFNPKIVECMTGKDPPRGGTYPYETQSCPVDSTKPDEVDNLFRDIDEHAYNVSQQEQADFLTLIWQLIYSRPVTQNVEKARAIFFWVCTKNFANIMFDEVEPESPEATLFGIKEGRTNYAHIFQTLCSYSGLTAKVIRGYAKANEYRPGMKLGGLQAQHVWNAVLVDGTWRFIDCYSAAHRIIGKKLTLEEIRKDLDDFYFMPDPAHLKFTHYPLEERWQLLKTPVELVAGCGDNSIKCFENLAPVRSAFFRYGLELFSHPHGVINAQEQLILKIRYPEHIAEKLSFTFTMNLEGLGEIYKGSNMQRYGMHEMTLNPPVTTFTLRFPRAGVFRLMIYARLEGQQIFGAVCEYRVEVELPVDEEGTAIRKSLAFPPTQQASYGPTEHAKKYSLRCSHQSSALLRVDNGSIDIRFFNAAQEEKLPSLIARLKSTTHSDQVLSQSIVLRSISGDQNHQQQLIVAAYLTDPGEYALEVYATDSDDDDSTFHLVWQFLLVSNSPCPLQGLPTLPSNSIGALEKFSSMGLSTVSHRDPLIRVPSSVIAGSEDLGSGWHIHGGDVGVQIQLPVANAERERIRVLTQFVFASNDEDKDFSEYVLQQKRGDQVGFVIRFPQPGYYKLHVHALPYSDPGENIPEVYIYLIDAPPRLSAKDTPYIGATQGSFPVQNALWKEGCLLEEPMGAVINVTEGKPTRFVATVPKGNGVGVMFNESWFPLESGDAGKYEGEIEIPAVPDLKVCLCAKYGTYATAYSTLLEYKVKVVN